MKVLTYRLGEKIQLVGDDLLCDECKTSEKKVFQMRLRIRS